MRAGVTGADLTAAAIEAHGGGDQPWMAHFYLGHGLGLDSAETPYVGTDLGDEYDQGLVLAGRHGPGDRADRVGRGPRRLPRRRTSCVITDDGCTKLTDYPYDPYGD